MSAAQIRMIDPQNLPHLPCIFRSGPPIRFGSGGEREWIVSTVRSFAENEIHPPEAEVERRGAVPQELGEEIRRSLADRGFFACDFPEAVGRAGLSHPDVTLVEREPGRGSMAPTRLFDHPQSIRTARAGERRERRPLSAMRGEKTDAPPSTEPDAGSDVRGTTCMAQRRGGDRAPNGSSHFHSGAGRADFFIVAAATGAVETPRAPKKRITCLLVGRGTPGVEGRPGYAVVSRRGDGNDVLG